jgi:hypothetical protein
MLIGMSEGNLNPSVFTDWRQETELGGVYWASALYNYILQNVFLATYFQANGDDEYGAIIDRGRPAYQSTLLYGKYGRVVGKQWLKTAYDQSSAPSIEALGFASNKEFSFLVINKEVEGTAYDISLDLANMPALTKLEVFGTSDKNLEVARLGEVPVVSGKLRYTFAPFSVTILRGAFTSARTLAPVTEAEPTKGALGLPIVGQYSWSGTPAVIARANVAPKIDGTMAPFAAAPPAKIAALDTAKVIGEKLKSYNDLTAEARMLWDNKNFYVAVEVTQDHPATNLQKENRIWNGDCVELYISSSAKLANQSRFVKSNMDYQIVMTPTSANGKPVFHCANGNFTDVTYAAQPTQTGYVVTAAIPLADFQDNDWAAGKKVKFDVAVSGAGKAGTSVRKIFWNAGSNAWDAPDEWGLAEIK